ncbi:DUF4376 domain-containing protein [Leptospira weilii]|uniref:DUF4376 domain-containing protein n=1 Tax=Leptospira weilii TaxID=28184 RepID=UPI000305502D|nr:hypothetical protein [Leptospira weilii]
MNYIIEKETRKVIWINNDPNRLSGEESWKDFNSNLHEVIYSLNYNPQISEVFKAFVSNGVAEEFSLKTVYNKISVIARVLYSWDEEVNAKNETYDEPLKDENGDFLPHQIHSQSGWVIDLQKKKDSICSLVNSICESKIVSGFTSSALGSPYFYDSDRDDQLNLVGLVSLNSSVPYKCTDSNSVKEYVNHSAQQIKQVLSDGAIRKTFLLQKVSDLKSAIQSALTIEEIDQIDINSGWG